MNLWELPHIQLAPEVIYTIPGTNFQITNTLFCTWISIVVLVALFFFATRRRDMIPSGLQNFMEWIIESLLGLVESVAGKENGRKFFPIVATFFFFIVVSNLLDILPGVDSIGQIHAEHIAPENRIGPFLFGSASNDIIPWVRPATTDLNLTLAMAVVAVLTAQGFGFYALGARAHLSKYINIQALLRGRIVEFFVGILEIASEVSRILSLAFRLFGNIFAGSIVLAVFAYLLPAFANIIFLPFELFVAAIQAYVFAFLTLVYLHMATIGHSHDEGKHAH